MGTSNLFLKALLSDYDHALVFIFDARNPEKAVCTGTVRGLMRAVDFSALKPKAFHVFECEDGSVQAEITV